MRALQAWLSLGLTSCWEPPLLPLPDNCESASPDSDLNFCTKASPSSPACALTLWIEARGRAGRLRVAGWREPIFRGRACEHGSAGLASSVMDVMVDARKVVASNNFRKHCCVHLLSGLEELRPNPAVQAAGR